MERIGTESIGATFHGTLCLENGNMANCMVKTADGKLMLSFFPYTVMCARNWKEDTFLQLQGVGGDHALSSSVLAVNLVPKKEGE